MENFRSQLESLINSQSKENGSNTPDFILAEYLESCLAAFDNATNARDKWHSRSHFRPIETLEIRGTEPEWQFGNYQINVSQQ